jgi:hypothetical protein
MPSWRRSYHVHAGSHSFRLPDVQSLPVPDADRSARTSPQTSQFRAAGVRVQRLRLVSAGPTQDFRPDGGLDSAPSRAEASAPVRVFNPITSRDFRGTLMQDRSRPLRSPPHAEPFRSPDVCSQDTGTGVRAVAMVMISCPNTGRDVPTGIETDPSSFESFGAAAPIHCRACGRAHAWSKSNAWLAGSLSCLQENSPSRGLRAIG